MKNGKYLFVDVKLIITVADAAVALSSTLVLFAAFCHVLCAVTIRTCPRTVP